MSCTLVNETCPAALSAVTFETNVFNLGNGDVQYTHEAAVPSGSTITLAAEPAANTFRLFKNGQVLVKDTDYTIISTEVTLLVAPTVDDVYVVDYLPTP